MILINWITIILLLLSIFLLLLSFLFVFYWIHFACRIEWKYFFFVFSIIIYWSMIIIVDERKAKKKQYCKFKLIINLIKLKIFFHFFFFLLSRWIYYMIHKKLQLHAIWLKEKKKIIWESHQNCVCVSNSSTKQQNSVVSIFFLFTVLFSNQFSLFSVFEKKILVNFFFYLWRSHDGN